MKNITNDVDNTLELQVIESSQIFKFNFEEIKVALTQRTEKYKDLVVTEDNLKDMEKEQKEITSLRTKLESFRKSEKKKLEDPIKSFEMQVKDLQKIIASVEEPLADQLKKYELDRVNKVKEDINSEAKEYALRVGLREQYLFDFIIPRELTNRGAGKAKKLKAIHELIDQLMIRQNNDDTTKILEEQKQELIKQLCISSSELYSLNTPVCPADVAHLTKDAQAAEIPELIKNHCKKRAEVEMHVLKTVTVSPEPVFSENVSQPSKREPSNEVKINIAIAVMGLNADNEEKLIDFIKTLGYEYKVIKRSELI